MLLPDGSFLIHEAAPYDPQKAHAYYLRTRQLKGRKKGEYSITTASGKTIKLSAQQLEEQKVYAAHRVEQLKKNLSDLGTLLRAKLNKAKEAEASAAKPPTLAEKATAAKKAEIYRKTHAQEIANKAKTAASKAPAKSTAKTEQKSDTVDSLKKEISSTKAKLKSAVAKQRELVSAKKNG